MKTTKLLQFGGKEVLIDDLELKIKEIWKQGGKLQKDLKKLDIYIKTEENKCYYVINNSLSGSFELVV